MRLIALIFTDPEKPVKISADQPAQPNQCSIPKACECQLTFGFYEECQKKNVLF